MTARIEALRRKDRRAWETVYEDCVDAVYRHAFYRLHGDREGAEDVTQEVFIRAIEGIETFRGDERALVGWLRGIGRRVMARRARERTVAAGRVVSLDEQNPAGESGHAPDLPDPRPLVSERLAAEERDLCVGAALTAMPPRWESALRWKYTDGLRVDAIAKRLGVTPKAAESLLSRAREAFRQIYIHFLACGNGRIHDVEEWPDDE